MTASESKIYETPPSVEHALIKAHGLAALVALLISALLGIFISAKMHLPDMAGTQAWTTWGRLRYDHTQGIFFGWLGNAFLMFLYHAVPRLANRAVLNRKLGWCLFAIWNFAVLLPGWALVLAGYSQPLEWAEFPLIVDAFVVLALIFSALQFVLPLLKANLSGLYVSGWYIIGGLIFTALAYPVGNIVPQLVPGAEGAAFSGLWIHDAVGLYVTPMALSIAYLLIPSVTKRPIYSHFLSMIGFWLLFFVYPLNGTHHYVFSAIPMEAQQAAIVASVYLGVDVILVVTNLLLSLRGSAALLKEDLPLRFVAAGTVFYLIVSLQGSLQALMPVNKLVHFSDWVIGHSHLAMIGFATFTAIGGMAHAWQRLPGARFNQQALRFCYWLLLAGLIFMVLDLSIAGLVEAQIWQSPAPWLDSVRAARGYWMARTLSGIPLIAAFVCLWIALTTGARNDIKAAQAAESLESQPDAKPAGEMKSAAGEELEVSALTQAKIEDTASPLSRSASLLNMAYLSASVAGLAAFLMSFSILGISPGLAIESDLKNSKPATMLPLSASEERGRLIYAREGCAYCHTQQVRAVASDVDRFGSPTRAWETIYDYPQLWGTRRVGPDLAREANVRSDDWQLAHLYNPRMLVRDSVMPPYPWLFSGTAVQPSEEGRDLLSYLKSLGRARQLAGVVTQALPFYCQCSQEMKRLETAPVALSVNASMARPSRAAVRFVLPSEPSRLASYKLRGALLFEENCAGCHGAAGRGDGLAAKSLMPAPANLTVKHFSIERLSFVLINGVYGSAMPAWRNLPQADLESLLAYVESLGTEPLAAVQPAPAAKDLFVKHCASCHGTAGDGNGGAAGALAPAATNFQEVCPSPARALVVINDGIAGTSMPPWKDQLSLEERTMLASYVASLYSNQVKKESQ